MSRRGREGMVASWGMVGQGRARTGKRKRVVDILASFFPWFGFLPLYIPSVSAPAVFWGH